MNVLILRSCVIVGILFLVACGGEPSESDISDAFAHSMNEATQAAQAGVASFGTTPAALEKMMPKLHGVKKIGCRAADGADGYVCDIETDMTLPMAGRQKQPASVRMVESDDGWRVLGR